MKNISHEHVIHSKHTLTWLIQHSFTVYITTPNFI